MDRAPSIGASSIAGEAGGKVPAADRSPQHGRTVPDGGDPRRVLHVIGGGDTGGAMSHLLPLLHALRDADCDARLLCLGGGGLAERARHEGLPVEVLPMARPYDPRVIPALAGRLGAGDLDVVHSHGLRANLPVRLVTALHRFVRRQTPCLAATVHSRLDLDYPPAVARLYGALDRLTAPVVDLTVYVSRELASRSGGDSGRGSRAARGFQTVIPSGLSDADLQRARAAASEGGRSGEASAPEGSRTCTVGTVARMVPVKDLGLLLEAFGRARTRAPGLRLVFVGEGPERRWLEERVESLGLEGRVEFRGEVRPVWLLLASLDVYAVSSISEGLPLSVLEAMAAGLPVVATEVGGIPEAVRHGRTGLLVPRGDDRTAATRRLADALVRLAEDPALRRSFGDAARRRVLDRFTARRAAAATLGAYRRCLSAGPTRVHEPTPTNR